MSKSPLSRGSFMRRQPSRIALLYAVIGALWILLSDKLLALMVADPATITRISLYKGWVYVALTAGLLYLLIRRDVGERSRAEEALKESEERYRGLFENTPAAMLLIDPDTADIVDANPAAASFYGYSREELVRMKITGLSNLTGGQVMNNLAEAKAGPDHVERRHRLKSGEMCDVEICRGPLAIDNRRYLFSIIHDITARKQAEASLKDSEDKLRAIADTATDAILLVDDDKRVVYCNRASARMFGYSCGELMGKDVDLIVPERQRQAHGSGFRRFAATGEGPLVGKTYEVSALRRDGTEFPVDLSISGILLKGRWHAAGIIRDTTERKSLENQLRHAQKMEALGTFSGGVAHDFNNILTAITAYCALIERKTAEGSPVRPYLAKLLASADRAAALTRSLLAYSRKQPLNPQPVDLNAIVGTIDHLLSRLLGEDVELAILPADQPLTVLADSLQIEQVLMNLASNARDAMPDGGIMQIGTGRLELGAEFIKDHGYGQPGSYALITVSDTGSGMDGETRERVFEPFFTTKEVGRGTGLGLSIVYGIIKQHNGFINLYSEPGKGTTFTIYLPLTDRAEENSVPEPPLQAKSGNETILLVEDDPEIRATLKELLENDGYRIIEAVDGEDGIRKFREHGDDVKLLILDVVMPKKNGKSVYDEISAVRPGIKTLFISGYTADILYAKSVIQADVNFMSKPVVISKLLEKIREVLDL